jgi:hypothetical protein
MFSSKTALVIGGLLEIASQNTSETLGSFTDIFLRNNSKSSTMSYPPLRFWDLKVSLPEIPLVLIKSHVLPTFQKTTSLFRQHLGLLSKGAVCIVGDIRGGLGVHSSGDDETTNPLPTQ